MFDGSMSPDSLRVLRSTRVLLDRARIGDAQSVHIDREGVERTAGLLADKDDESTLIREIDVTDPEAALRWLAEVLLPSEQTHLASFIRSLPGE